MEYNNEVVVSTNTLFLASDLMKVKDFLRLKNMKNASIEDALNFLQNQLQESVNDFIKDIESSFNIKANTHPLDDWFDDKDLDQNYCNQKNMIRCLLNESGFMEEYAGGNIYLAQYQLGNGYVVSVSEVLDKFVKLDEQYTVLVYDPDGCHVSFTNINSEIVEQDVMTVEAICSLVDSRKDGNEIKNWGVGGF